MLESHAYRSLSLSARRVMDRIELEHLKHGGKDNGKLPVTHRDFIHYGVRAATVRPAQQELIHKGFARITKKGRSGKNGIATEFRLTYIHADNRPPTNDWKRYNRISDETSAISVAKRRRLGSEVQQNPTDETSAIPTDETSALSIKTSSTASAGCAEPDAA